VCSGRARQFVGELNLLTGQTRIVSARVARRASCTGSAAAFAG